MREFIRGWRRKAGCVTLVMACVVMVAWVRSRIIIDTLKPTTRCFISSERGSIVCDCIDSHPQSSPVPGVWRSKSISEGYETVFDHARHANPKWRWDFRWGYHGFFAGAGTSSPPFSIRHRILACPHWAVVLPLTLLSAYLIIRNPRKRKAEFDA